MTDWRESILNQFRPGSSRVTIAADPDGLLFEERVFQRITEMGFEILFIEDTAAFGYAYESTYGVKWGEEEPSGLVIVLKTGVDGLDALPCAVLESSRKLSFDLTRIFPEMSYPVIKGLDSSDFDALDEAIAGFRPGPLGENDSKDFILRHVFEIAPELIKRPSDILSVLLRRHYRTRRIPPELDAWLISGLREKDEFAEWPLEAIVPDRTAFFRFLQERWPIFLDRFAENMAMVSDWGAPYGLEYAGPLELPFGHDDVRVYLDHSFTEGFLEPVEHHDAERLSGTWASIGIKYDPETDRMRRLHRLLTTIVENIPSIEAGHVQWLSFTPKWGEALALNENEWFADERKGTFGLTKIRAKMDDSFSAWINDRFTSLIGRSPSPPVTTRHIPWHLAKKLDEEKTNRLALIIIDGLSYDQWVTVRSVLKYQAPDLRFREAALFAWIPTLISVSRQTIFSGKVPICFSDSITTTARESLLWSQFWFERGFKPNNIGYFSEMNHNGIKELKESLSSPDLKIVGLTIDTLEKMMHDTPPAGAYGLVRQWAQTGFLSTLIDRFHVNGFRVWLASDHGNIETTGIGRIEEKTRIETGGERVVIFPTKSLHSRAGRTIPDALPCPPAYLPNDFQPLLAPGRTSFTEEKKRSMAHGGISIEEVIVPFVEVFPRQR